MRAIVILLLLLALIVLSGCGLIPRGLLYNDTTDPFCTDARGTSLGTTSETGSTKAIEIPISAIDIATEWDSRAIGDIAKQHGISTVYGCDFRREYYLLGLWRRERLIVYGDL